MLFYIDPNIGSLIFQLLIAIFTGILFFFSKVRIFFSKLFKGYYFRKKKDED
ncbi:MAG: hypothetical protein IH950_15265 [Bacteroidetes bacterium]|nr:hypothetical protein [Bacteroidota bacterium]